MQVFCELGVDTKLNKNLVDSGITEPTEIQRKAIPIAIEGRDILGSAQTGTGKTFAFLLPLLTRLIKKEIKKAIIIEPTRELAQQVVNNVSKLLPGISGINYVLLIGGESYLKQLKMIKNNPQIFICTPGRVIDHLNQGNISLNDCDYVVIDETDRMFDMGFYEQLEEIFKNIPLERQTLMFSATFPKEIEEMANKHLKDPERIFVQTAQKANVIADNLVVESVKLSKGEKYKRLVEELNKVNNEKTIIFVKTKSDVEYITYKLKDDGFKVGGIHGDMRQRKREKTVELYRKNKFNILVGTDIISRGLDVPNVMTVINYNIPCVPEDYIHRIGRTARAGAKGFAISFITEDEEKYWLNIQKMLYPEKYKDIPKNYTFNRNRNKNKTRGKNRFHFFGRKHGFRKFDKNPETN